MRPARRWWLALAFVLAAIAVSFGPDAVGADPSTEVGVLWLTGFSQLLWVALALGIAAASSTSMRDRLGWRPSRLSPWALAAAIVGMLGWSAAVNGVLVWLQLRDASALQEIDRIVVASREQAPVLAVVALALLPGFAEELLFRGAILEALRARAGTWLAIGGSALCFGLAHVEPIHAAAAALLGGYLGFVAVRAGSVWPAIACHLANNAVGVAAQWGGVAQPGQRPELAAACGLLAAACLAAVAMLPTKPPRTPASPRGGHRATT